MMRKIIGAILCIVLMGLFPTYAKAQTLCSDCPDPSDLVCAIAPASCQQCWNTCVNELPEPPRIRRPDRRVPGQPGEEYPIFDRSVGVNIQFSQTPCAPAPWWPITCQYESVITTEEAIEKTAIEYDLNIFAIAMNHHPWEVEWENPRRAFRTPFADVLVIAPLAWGYQTMGCDGDQIVEKGFVGIDYPTDDSMSHTLCYRMPDYTANQRRLKDECYWRNQGIFNGLYEMYGEQKKDIIITSTEDDWDVFGAGCRDWKPCPAPENYWARDACKSGTLAGQTFEDCDIEACWQWRHEMANYLLLQYNKRQAAAMKARKENPMAALRVWHGIEVNFFGTEDWQYITVVKDVIPRMDNPPDFILVSLYSMSDGPEHAINYVMEHTGLPASRIIVSETGTKDHSKQYDRIYNWINKAFMMGVRLAFVWDVEIGQDVYDTGYSIVDRTTGEWFPGMQAVHDLNEKWRNR